MQYKIFSIFINITTSICKFKYYKFVILLEIFENCFLTRTGIEILYNTNSKNLSFVYFKSIDRHNSNSTSNSLINNISFINTQFSLVIFLSLYYITRFSIQFEILYIECCYRTLKTILLKIENFSYMQDLKELIKLEFLKIMSNIIFLKNKKAKD